VSAAGHIFVYAVLGLSPANQPATVHIGRVKTGCSFFCQQKAQCWQSVRKQENSRIQKIDKQKQMTSANISDNYSQEFTIHKQFNSGIISKNLMTNTENHCQ